MRENEPPIRIVAPGRVFRNESTDARHEAEFYQMEGLLVGKDISIVNFKEIIGQFLKKYIGRDLEIRTRPGYFPFVEPGFEIDVTCFGCNGGEKSCELCSGTN
jgi:phenylalanyl-tRNA synthetase alpha chain